MVAHKPPNRLLLRAELRHTGERIITHTIDISEALVFVPTDRAAFIGDTVMVDFSFPGLLAPFSIETQVIARRLSSGPGNPPGWTLGFMFYSEAEKARLSRLLDRAAATQTSHVPVPRSTANMPPYRVLLVEDNQMMREAFALEAKKLMGPTNGILVDIVANGDDAIDKLRDHSYDLAIVDYFLPMLNGDQLISRLRRKPALAELPIFAISVGGGDVRQATLAAGADLFLQKPIVMRDLFHTLRQLVSVRDREHN